MTVEERCQCPAYEAAGPQVDPLGPVPICVCGHSAAWHWPDGCRWPPPGRPDDPHLPVTAAELAGLQALRLRLDLQVASPATQASCGPCGSGRHDKCKKDAYHELMKKRVPCGCPLRSLEGHP